MSPITATFAESLREKEIVEPMAPVKQFVYYKEEIEYYSDTFPVSIHRRVYDSGHYYQGYITFKSLYKSKTENYIIVTYDGTLYLADYGWNNK